MKKLLIAACGAALMLTASCNHRSISNPQNVEFGDSVANVFGQVVGSQALQQYQMMQEQAPENYKTQFKKEEYLKGIKAVLDVDSANYGYLMGLQMGMRVYGAIYNQGEDAGVTINPDVFIKAMKEVYMRDSIGDLNTGELQQTMQVLGIRMQAMAQERRDNMTKASEEYKLNTEAGEKAAADSVAAGFQKSETGLVYKIENAGEGETLKANDSAQIVYVGKHLNGEVFDESPAEGRRFNVSGVVPGFKEGLMMLGKGGKATIVIPGELAYGLNGAQGANIGPNETLVFEITVLDINPGK